MGLGMFPRDGENRIDFSNNQGIQIKAVKGMIDRILAPRDATIHDYSSDGNILPVEGGRNSFVEFLHYAFNIVFYISPPWFVRWFLVGYIWYPYYRESFGFCGLCVFTLFGFVDKVEPWNERTTNLLA